MRRIFLRFGFACLLFPLIAFGEDKKQPDSLEQVLATYLKEDTGKAELLYKLGMEYRFSDWTKAMDYQRQSLTLSEQLSWKLGQIKAKKNMAVLHADKSDYHLTLEGFKDALKLAEEGEEIKEQSDLHNNIGLVHYYQGRYLKAIESYLNAAGFQEQLGNEHQLATIYNNIGLIYFAQKRYNKSIEYHNKALEYWKEKDSEHSASCYSNIGKVYIYGLENFSEGAKFCEKAESIYLELNNKSKLGLVYSYLGTAYLRQEKYSLAERYFKGGIYLHESIGDKRGKVQSMGMLSEVYEALEKYDLAKDYAAQAIEVSEEIGALAETRENYSRLSKIYTAMGNYKEANVCLSKYAVLQDSVLSIENSRKIAELEGLYEYEKNQKKIKEQEADLKQQELRESYLTNILFIVTGVTLLILLLLFFLYRAYQTKNRVLHITEVQKEKISNQKQIIEDKNRDITDSILYAQKIQEALLVPTETIRRVLPNHFILFRPRDFVSGDFYWVTETDCGKRIWVVADCTGHGVPGALMSVIGMSLLNELVLEKGIYEPGILLDNMRSRIINSFTREDKEQREGMDLTVCVWDVQKSEVHYAGANNPLYIIKENANDWFPEEDGRFVTYGDTNGMLVEVVADRMPVGSFFADYAPFKTVTIPVSKGDQLYCFSDGYADQFGGDKGKKLKYQAFKNLLIANRTRNMSAQKERMEDFLIKWKGTHAQVDDILLMGVKIDA